MPHMHSNTDSKNIAIRACMFMNVYKGQTINETGSKKATSKTRNVFWAAVFLPHQTKKKETTQDRCNKKRFERIWLGLFFFNLHSPVVKSNRRRLRRARISQWRPDAHFSAARHVFLGGRIGLTSHA